MFRYPFIFIKQLSICLRSTLYSVLENIGCCSEDTIQQFNFSYVVCYRAKPVAVCFVTGQACCFIVMETQQGWNQVTVGFVMGQACCHGVLKTHGEFKLLLVLSWGEHVVMLC